MRRRPGFAVLVVLVVGVVTALGVAERHGGPEYSSDWSSPAVLSVVQHGDRLDLVALDPSTARVRALGRLPVRPDQAVVPQTALVADGRDVLAVVARGNGFAATVVRVDVARRRMSVLGQVADGRFPSLEGGLLVGFGSHGSAGYTLPALHQQWTKATTLQPYAADGACRVGVLSRGGTQDTAVARGGAEPSVVRTRAEPGGVACTSTWTAVSIAALLPPGADPQSPPPGDQLAVSGERSFEVTVGAHPQVVATDGNRLAVDTDAPGRGRDVVLVDEQRQAVMRRVPEPAIGQVVAMHWAGGRLLVLGDTEVASVDPATGVSRTARLSGTAVGYEVVDLPRG